MKISELWLREWVNPALTCEELGESLTMAGLEVEAISPVAEKFSGVVVAEILQVEKHPEADRLQLCTVNVGGSEPLIIVCGAKNVTVGMKTAAALDGAVLSNKMKITKSKLRGVFSHGMLCSTKELGLAEESEGLIVLPPDAPVGENAWDYLRLSDHIIEVSITPNRGDCLSVLGLAQDIAALTKTPLSPVAESKINSTIDDTRRVVINAPTECPHYVGRLIQQVTADAATPMWMQERLRRSSIRCISPVVDVMNYVMLELGQPMHAFDLAKITGEIHVRMATTKEQLALLDGQTVTLTQNTLVIADQEKPLAIAGVMGGLESGVTSLTKDIFLESAFFQPMCVSQSSRHYKLNSESSYRFERGVDSALQLRAIERATQLLLEIVGGKAGPIIDAVHIMHLPQAKKILLRSARIAKILGLKIADQVVATILQSLGFAIEKTTEGWEVTVPPRRFDIAIEVDLIEEIIRVYGYDQVPLAQPIATMRMNIRSEEKIFLPAIRNVLCDLGYQEVVTYSFIDKKMQALFDPEQEAKELLNPITAEMSVMRTSLWPGLMNTYLYNQNRQQSRVMIFESGLRFVLNKNELEQQNVLAGLVSGNVLPEQWGVATRPTHFFDLKGDLETIFHLTGASHEFEFKTGSHPVLHPGQTAEIYRAGKYVGILGMLHPSVRQKLDIEGNIALFELHLDGLEAASLPHFAEISRFPEIRRDIAILVNQTVPAGAIQATITDVVGELLQSVNVFDVYQGKGIAAGHKSVALALTLQHASRTLVDEEVADLMARVIQTLQEKFAAELRG